MAEEGIPHEPVAAIEPVPIVGRVNIDGPVPTTEEAADFGNYRSINLLGTEDKQQLLPMDRHRVRAYIIVTGTGPVYVGSEAQCAAVRAGHPEAAGAVLATGMILPVGHKQPVWLIGDGSHTAIVSVVQERNQT